MNELIDKFLFELFDGLRDKTTVLFGEFIADAQALAAIFMLLYFGVESFKMMSGDKKLEIIPLLRPFALGLVLMFWIPFINLISYPGELLTARSKAMFTNQIEEVELLSRNRYALIDSVAVELLHTSLEVERAENEVKDKKWYDFSIDFSAIGDKIAGLYVYVVAKVKMIMFNIIEFIVVTFWQVLDPNHTQNNRNRQQSRYFLQCKNQNNRPQHLHPLHIPFLSTDPKPDQQSEANGPQDQSAVKVCPFLIFVKTVHHVRRHSCKK